MTEEDRLHLVENPPRFLPEQVEYLKAVYGEYARIRIEGPDSSDRLQFTAGTAYGRHVVINHIAAVIEQQEDRARKSS